MQLKECCARHLRTKICEIFDGFVEITTTNMNGSLSKEITQCEFSTTNTSMTKGKAQRHDMLPMNCFNNFSVLLVLIFSK